MRISWYGRCCFLVDFEHKAVLFDPYDQYCNVDIDLIEADILISSSSWHDHGHIGASPGAWVYTYPGTEVNDGVKITGIEAKENRGTPTIIFNIQYADYSITNFADFGPEQHGWFDDHINREEKEILATTNIAFARPSIIGEDRQHNEIFLNYCQPNVIFPEHYFPKSFIYDQVPSELQKSFLEPIAVVDEMPEALNYKLKDINDYKIDIQPSDFQLHRQFFKFQSLHPQVKYEDIDIKRNW